MTYSILDLTQTFVGGTLFGMGLAGLLWLHEERMAAFRRKLEEESL